MALEEERRVWSVLFMIQCGGSLVFQVPCDVSGMAVAIFEFCERMCVCVCA